MGVYIPCKGDYVAVSFDPQAGHEQQGRRPALVVSNDLFNSGTGLCIVCPITRTDRAFPFHVRIPAGEDVEGCVMVEQVKSLDCRSRGMRRIGKASAPVLAEALAILDSCLY